MEIPYDQAEKIKIKQRAIPKSAKAYANLGPVLILLPPSRTEAALGHHPLADDLIRQYRRQRKALNQGSIRAVIGMEPDAQAILVRWPDKASVFEHLSSARQWATRLLQEAPRQVTLDLSLLDSGPAADAARSVLTALLTRVCDQPSFKAIPPAPAPLKQIVCLGNMALDVESVRTEVMGNHLARWLTRLPGNHLTPRVYRDYVEAMARDEGWQVRFFNRKRLDEAGAGAFLAVTQAAPEQDSGILQLRYRPGRRNAPPRVALVGKGICFDTGGVNIKSTRAMNGMHEDMQGSAVALGTFLALTRRRIDYPVDCWLALAENPVGPHAYRPNDVVTASNGTSIEIIHTDAEGRMVLADTLALAAGEAPELIVDYATLTGSCIDALSTRYAGAFSNRTDWYGLLIEVGRGCGERVWPFPMDEDYDESLASEVADIKQCIIESEADHILAARFLNRFVPDKIRWLHLDLASGHHKGGLAHVSTDITGFGVRYTLALLSTPDIPLPAG